jgi:hypothetical protein
MKGAIATQVGLVQFANFSLADNGGGPRAHIVNGKDNGANMELTWILDDRNRDDEDNTSPVPSLPLSSMAGGACICTNCSPTVMGCCSKQAHEDCKERPRVNNP